MPDRVRRLARAARASVALACVVLICAACAVASAAKTAEARGGPAVPDDGFTPGWVKSGPTLRFTPASLFDYIDGGAELFLEFGFKELLVQRYALAGTELTLEIYKMDSPEAALGIYLARSDAETPVKGIQARNTGTAQQVTVLKGSVFLLVNNFGGGEESLPVTAALVNRALEHVPQGKPVTLFQSLPRENLVPGSEALERGPFGLQPIFTFGNGDVLQLRGKVFAVVGDYREPGAETDASPYTRIVVIYPSRSAAKRAYANLVANLDPYLKVLRTTGGGSSGRAGGSRGATGDVAGPGGAAGSSRDSSGEPGFIFKDFQSRFGSVELKGHLMDIKINLSREP